MFDAWRRYVPVAQRRRKAELAMAKLKKKGHPVSPVVIDGRAIAKTFWGKAWCDNLEHYSDYANRLPRGRTYVRNGSVLDLQVAGGEVRALVRGSAMYKVAVKVTPVPKDRWSSVCTDCAGGIDSLIELLQGRFSKGVMERICRNGTGLFPSPKEITLSCSCPDWATMCKHVAAVLYGIGARLDEQPELLFKLRAVNEKDLVAKAGMDFPLAKAGPAREKVLVVSDLSELFGLELGQGREPEIGARSPGKKPKRAKTPAPDKVARLEGRKSPARRKRGVDPPTKRKPTTKR